MHVMDPPLKDDVLAAISGLDQLRALDYERSNNAD